MYKILTVTAFGFIFELENDQCYNTDTYDVYLNGERYLSTDKNVVSIFSLKSDTVYRVDVLGHSFEVRTKKPEFLIDVRDYNATGDGVTDDTSAINLAIYTAPVFSTVYIPEGVYMVDQILLKSGVDIFLAKGAVLRQNTCRKKLAILKAYQKSYDFDDVRVNASWEGHPLDSFCSLIYGKDVFNVHIYGEGMLDGNGSEGDFWINPKVKNMAFRPKNILLVGCKNIQVSGITSVNSASWNIHPMYSQHLAFRALTIKSEADSPNTDGLNPESCENVEIIGCHFSVGDDCIAIKAGKYYMSVKHYQPTKHIIIRNCLMENGHGGVVIGSEMACGVYDVTVTQCLFRNTDRGLRVKTRRGRGALAVVDGIKFDNVKMENVRHCFVVNMFYNCDPDGKSDYVKSKTITAKDELTPTVKNIIVSKINAIDITGCAVFIYGLPENKVSEITVKDSSFEFSNQRVIECPAMMDDFDPIEKLGFHIKNVRNAIFLRNKIKGEYATIGVKNAQNK